MRLPDSYLIVARVFPAILAGLPAIAFIAIFVSWGSLNLTHLIATSALGFLLFAFADIARRRAYKIQPQLYANMGGMPSTVMLRHRDDTFSAEAKNRLHSFLAQKLSAPAPTLDEEKADPNAADDFYSRGATWLRENTRNKNHFKLLFDENVTYGFRRNLLALRTPGFLLNLAVAIACCIIFWLRWPVDLARPLDQKALAVIIIAVLHAGYLAFFVNEEGVAEAARIYARQLLLSSESDRLQKNVAAKPAKSRKSRSSE